MHSLLVVGMTLALIFPSGMCIVQIQSVQVDFVCTKRLFDLLVEAIIIIRNVGLCAWCAIFLLKIKHFPFLSFCQWVYIFEESPKSIQDVIGDVYCPGKSCFNREECEFFGGYVTTPRSIHSCGKCGAWLFDHKVPFTLQRHVKTTKQTKHAAKRDELGTHQINVT